MTQITRLHILAPSTLYQVQDLSERTGRTGEDVVRMAVEALYAKENEMKVLHQYWKHKRSGETYAVRIEDGKPAYISGPVHYEEEKEHGPDDYNFDDPFEDNPNDYNLA